ncbi:hypothetical protein J3R30DRAFT_66870 [Lentinula aciculospora]|uniref:Uncharacterized protein n=1 Tax=Lentinula aciculospora TaxID=153920 RepID=A0A9W9DY10_9AGAR|nr:hypothetical protein J3R30DRAFT_66870 [Lentinula aciculospora]
MLRFLSSSSLSFLPSFICRILLLAAIFRSACVVAAYPLTLVPVHNQIERRTKTKVLPDKLLRIGRVASDGKAWLTSTRGSADFFSFGLCIGHEDCIALVKQSGGQLIVVIVPPPLCFKWLRSLKVEATLSYSIGSKEYNQGQPGKSEFLTELNTIPTLQAETGITISDDWNFIHAALKLMCIRSPATNEAKLMKAYDSLTQSFAETINARKGMATGELEIKPIKLIKPIKPIKPIKDEITDEREKYKVRLQMGRIGQDGKYWLQHRGDADIFSVVFCMNRDCRTVKQKTVAEWTLGRPASSKISLVTVKVEPPITRRNIMKSFTTTASFYPDPGISTILQILADIPKLEKETAVAVTDDQSFYNAWWALLTRYKAIPQDEKTTADFENMKAFFKPSIEARKGMAPNGEEITLKRPSEAVNVKDSLKRRPEDVDVEDSLKRLRESAAKNSSRMHIGDILR